MLRFGKKRAYWLAAAYFLVGRSMKKFFVLGTIKQFLTEVHVQHSYINKYNHSQFPLLFFAEVAHTCTGITFYIHFDLKNI